MRQRTKDWKFFAEVMQTAFKEADHQTAHMLHCALTHSSLRNIVVPKRMVPMVSKHWVALRGPDLRKARPLLENCPLRPNIALCDRFQYVYNDRRRFMGRMSEVKEVNEHMELFQYLEHDKEHLLPVYTRSSGQIVAKLR